MKRLQRSKTDKIAGGVMGGLGAYFSVDPVIFRLLFVLLLLASGVIPGVIMYIIAVLIIPEQSTITPSRPVSETEPKKPTADDTSEV